MSEHGTGASPGAAEVTDGDERLWELRHQSFAGFLDDPNHLRALEVAAHHLAAIEGAYEGDLGERVGVTVVRDNSLLRVNAGGVLALEVAPKGGGPIVVAIWVAGTIATPELAELASKYGARPGGGLPRVTEPNVKLADLTPQSAHDLLDDRPDVALVRRYATSAARNRLPKANQHNALLEPLLHALTDRYRLSPSPH